MQKPEYDRLRESRGFSWSVSATYLALLDITGIPIREYNTRPEAGIELFRRGRAALREMYGQELGLPGPMTPPISYGHVNALGLELVFPEGGEVNYVRSRRSLEEWCGILERSTDYAHAGMIGTFQAYQAELAAAFPGEKVSLHWGYEGPMTTAYELRDMAVFTDAADRPELFRRFLELASRSIVDFARFMRRLQGEPEVNPVSSGLCDDVASMFGPPMWRSFVLPSWEMYYSGLTTGTRSVHVEDLRPDQLRFLEEAGVSSYDPSISAKINPRLIASATRVPFGWRLANFHYPGLTETEVREWVFQAVADGASQVFTYVCAGMCTPPMVRKVQAFSEACRESKRMLQSGASRADVGKNVSPSGRARFWARWP
jgi:hypothetical protein